MLLQPLLLLLLLQLLLQLLQLLLHLLVYLLMLLSQQLLHDGAAAAVAAERNLAHALIIFDDKWIFFLLRPDWSVSL